MTNFKKVKQIVENLILKKYDFMEKNNIYTFESPGGWNIIGNTPLKVFDTSNEDAPNLINPGDIVRFKEINIEEYRNFNE